MSTESRDSQRAQEPLVDSLPAFDPPEDYQFEPEVRAAAPRALPGYALDKLRNSRRTTYLVLAFAAGSCLALDTQPWIRTFSLYFLPLGYLPWIAGGLFAMLVIAYLRRNSLPKHYVFLRDGAPQAARIEQLVKAPTAIMNGQATHYAYKAVVTLRKPEDGEAFHVGIQSEPFSADKRNDYDCTYKVGDYVTALRLSGKKGPLVQLYGFLGLDPKVGVVRKQGWSWGGHPLKVLALLVFVLFFFISLMWNVYAFGKYEPLQVSFREMIPVIIPGVVLGLAIIVGLYARFRKMAREIRERNAEAVRQGQAVEVGSADVLGQKGLYGLIFKLILLVGIPFLCSILLYCWAITFNAWFDHSPAEFKRVKIVDMLMVTHGGIFREYELKYILAGETEKRSLMSTPQHLGLFLGTDLGEAEIHKGAFGWKWVKTIRPVKKANFQSEVEEKPAVPANDEYRKLLVSSMAELKLKTQAHQVMGLHKFERWDLDQKTCELVFSNADGYKAICPAQIIGSYNSTDKTWLWAWANPSVIAPLKVDALKVKAYGEKHKITELTMPGWRGTEADAWNMVALAVKLCSGQGAYRGPAGDTYFFISYGPVVLTKQKNKH